MFAPRALCRRSRIATTLRSAAESGHPVMASAAIHGSMRRPAERSIWRTQVLSLRQQFSSGREGTASDPPKCERFCTFIIAGQSAEDAYELAGYTPDRRGARRLRARPDVDARIKWLRAQKDGAVQDAKAE